MDAGGYNTNEREREGERERERGGNCRLGVGRQGEVEKENKTLGSERYGNIKNKYIYIYIYIYINKNYY